MIEMSDPLERLRAANPVPHAEVALLSPDPVLFRRITAGEAPAVRRHRRRLRRLVPVLAVTGLLGGAVANAVLRDGVTKPTTVACYERADLAAATEVSHVGPEGPLAACADLWRQGVLGTGAEVPPLAECTLPSGVAGVFPVTAGVDPCPGLDLPPVPSTAPPPPPPPPSAVLPPPADLNARILAFRDATVPQFLDSPCVTPEAGAELVRRELERAGLGDWSVTASGFSADRPCATLALRPETREVALVPAPPRR